MTSKGCICLWVAVSVLFFCSSTHVTSAQEKPSPGTEQIDPKGIWKKVIEVNQVWLDPRSTNLSYKISSGSPPPDQPETTQLIWVSGDKGRWEMESGVAPDHLEYTLIITPERSEYLRGPEGLLNKPMKRRTLTTLRQAITWNTAIHALRRNGLPDDTKVFSDTTDGGNRLIVLETTTEGRGDVGLGLYHVFYGATQRPIGRCKLTLRLPDHVLLREEWSDGTLIEYGPEYLKVSDGLAPGSIRHVSKLPAGKTWVLAAYFQTVNDCWLLKTAQNLQNDVVVKQMNVQEVSTVPISAEKFVFPKKD